MQALAPQSSAPTAHQHHAFCEDVRDFARTACPQSIREKVRRNDKLGRPELAHWQALLHARGWGAPGWPTTYGGTGWDVYKRILFEEVMAQEDCPVQYHHGLGHIGPVLMAFGTPEQKARFLPDILTGQTWWCQGYSEPGAGSDLASLKTRAQARGDHYVVTGQKTWTSHAHEADWMYALTRTTNDARKQDGITLLLIALDTPGVTVRPIRTIDGWHHLNEVFFDEVRVPVANRVGEDGGGWRCAKYLLERERLPPAGIPRLMRLWQRVAGLLETQITQADSHRDLTDLRSRLLLAQAELKGARHLLARAVHDLLNDRPLGARPSVLKLLSSELGQRIMDIALEAVGPTAAGRFLSTDAHVPADTHALWIHNYLFFRSRSLAGGTSEVQRNVIARELFGS